MTGRRLQRESFAKLLDDPLRRRVVGRVEVQNTSPVVVDDEEAVQDVRVAVGTVKKSIPAMAAL